MDDTVKSCKPSRTRAFTLIELMVVIAIIGILAAILLPTLSMALKHAKRIKCVSNMRQIGAAFHGFSVDNSQRLPWQLTAGGRKTQYGNHYSWEPNVVFCSTSMRSELSNPALLVSPCDPDRKSSNEKAIAMWGKVSPRNPIPREAVSYNLCEGADVSRPTTVLALTRNLSTDNIAMARWVGAEEATPQSMGLLGSNKGQILLTDGSVPFSKDSDLKSSGNVVGQHLTATGGITVGQSSARVMGWSNNPKVILAQHFFHLGT